ncbi:MAG: lipocalin family protein [Candidatus Binatia bacterium]|nr:lipocalin family protein [Candidatus Binatia bacterium]
MGSSTRVNFRHVRALLTLGLLGAIGCTGIPEGLEPVGGFRTERYLGTWYEIARLDHSFERGLQDVSATYSARSGGGIRVVNRGYDPTASEWREAVGLAYPLGDPGIGSLKVSFFGPFYGGYHVIALDEDYGWAVVVGPDRSYLWFLARDRSLTAERREALLSVARDGGFDVAALVWVEQDRDDPALEQDE